MLACWPHGTALVWFVGNGLDCSAAMELSSLGKTAEKMLLEVPVHFTSTALDAYVIMPNHIHCILAIGCNELSERSRPFPTLLFMTSRKH